jgi:(2Fe-2S) ferredoxin
MVRPTVFVCRGSSCRRRSAYADLCRRLSVVADLAEVRCQRICDGPVVGVAINGSLEWFARVNSEKAQRQMVDLVSEGGRIRRTLEKRRVAKRAGRLR